MFEFLNKLFKNKQLSEQQKASIIELVDKEESFINPRDVVVKKTHPKKPAVKAWSDYVTPSIRTNDRFTEQVEKEIETLFDRLCDIADIELKKQNKNIKHVKYDYYYYRVSIFDEIYRLAKETVYSFYRLENTQPADFLSYTLEAMLPRDVQTLLMRELDAYHEVLPFPDEETRKQFGLTSFGTKVIWWDPSGELRNKEIFDVTEMEYFNHLKKRTTKFTEVSAIMSLCLEKYLDLLHIVLHDIEDESVKWKIKPNNYFRKYFRLPLDDARIWGETDRLPTDLYLLTENRIRKEIEGFRLLASEESLQSLQKYLPNETFEKIQEYLNQEINLELDYSTITSLRNVYKTAWNEAANFIIDQSAEQIGVMLEDIAKDPDLKKIATKVMKQSNDPDKHIVFIFLMEKMMLPLSKAQQKEQDSFIHPTRQADYQQLLLAQDLPNENVPALLKELAQPARREVKLDNELITASHSALSTMIDMVDDYLGEEEMDANINPVILDETEISPAKEQIESETSVSVVEETEKTASNQNFEHMEFLKYVVAGNGIALEEFKQQATNKGKLYQAYLNELNEVLYEVFEDQVLMIHQQQVMIEDDFIEEMREWVNG